MIATRLAENATRNQLANSRAQCALSLVDARPADDGDKQLALSALMCADARPVEDAGKQRALSALSVVENTPCAVESAHHYRFGFLAGVFGQAEADEAAISATANDAAIADEVHCIHIYKLEVALADARAEAAAAAQAYNDNGLMPETASERLAMLVDEIEKNGDIEEKHTIFVKDFLTRISHPSAKVNDLIGRTALHFAGSLDSRSTKHSPIFLAGRGKPGSSRSASIFA